MIKMIALDLDNTLLNSDKQISIANQETLKVLHEQGIAVVLCTGRPINAVWPYVKQLDLLGPNDYTITFNGGMIVKNDDQSVLSKKSLSKADFNLIHQFATEYQLPLDILDFEKVYELTDLVKSTYQEVLNSPLQFVTSSFSALPDQEYSKAIMSEQVETLNQARANLSDEILAQYQIVRSQPQIMEFLPKNMSKAAGLKILLQHFNLDFANLMAFGDAENDKEMLQAAQMGVAMENASDEIKAIADDITLNHDDDGVAVYLHHYFNM